MNKLIVFFCLLGVALATQKSYSGYKVFQVKVDSSEKFDVLKSIQFEEGLDFWDAFHKTDAVTRIMVAPEKLSFFEGFLSNNKISFEVIIMDVETIFLKERTYQETYRAAAAQRKAEGRSTVEFTHFWTNDEINDYLDELATTFPNIATVETVGQSYEGRPIRAIHISLGGGLADGSKPIILIDTTIHAREWIAAMVGLHLIHELVEHSEENLDVLEEVDWVIVAMANPDGYAYAHSSDRMWRKTRQPNAGSTCVGVDPNRNFNFQWDVSGGASTNPCSDAYRGTAANTETEVQALSTLMQRWDSTKVYISIHSYGNYILYPWGYALNNNIDNWGDHEEVGTNAKNAIEAVSGTRYSLGNAAALLYIASGASDDFAAGRGTTELAFTLELPGGGSSGFDIEASRIPGVVAETFPALREYGKFVVSRWGKK